MLYLHCLVTDTLHQAALPWRHHPYSVWAQTPCFKLLLHLCGNCPYSAWTFTSCTNRIFPSWTSFSFFLDLTPHTRSYSACLLHLAQALTPCFRLLVHFIDALITFLRIWHPVCWLPAIMEILLTPHEFWYCMPSYISVWMPSSLCSVLTMYAVVWDPSNPT